MNEQDVLERARALRRDAFAAFYGCCFLIARQQLRSPDRARTTASYHAFSPGLLPPSDREWTAGPRTDDEATWIVLPVKKRVATFPSMITVGRTANNDLVVNDVSVSKFHAHFRQRAEHLELTDASSRNGTFVAGKALPASGSATIVRPNDAIRFGRVEFTLVDALLCWERLRAL